MREDTQRKMDETLKNAFWALDFLPEGLVNLVSLAQKIEYLDHELSVELTCHVASVIRENAEGMSVALGILRKSLTDLRLATPSFDDGEDANNG